MDQWADEFRQHSNLPAACIGFLGAGQSDHFNDTRRVLICVLNSAAKKLASEVENAGVEKDLLLIVDECHRAGAPEMERVFRTKRSYNLGLSATPERDDEDLIEDTAIEGMSRMTDSMDLAQNQASLNKSSAESLSK